MAKMRRRLFDWIRRPQWQLRSLFLLVLIVAIVCSLAQYLRQGKIVWVPYNSTTLAHCRQMGRPVLVVYYTSTSPIHRIYAFSPFRTPDVARLINRTNMLAMDAELSYAEAKIKELPAMLRDVGADLADLSSRPLPDLPLIVIYDARNGDVVIRPVDNEGCNKRAARVGELLRRYERRGIVD